MFRLIRSWILRGLESKLWKGRKNLEELMAQRSMCASSSKLTLVLLLENFPMEELHCSWLWSKDEVKKGNDSSDVFAFQAALAAFKQGATKMGYLPSTQTSPP